MLKQYFEKLELKQALTHLKEFEELLNLYQTWNAKINISAIKNDEEVIVKHFCDSLLITKLDFYQNKNLKIADLGTGGGYPLLPLAIVSPQNNFLGVDSVQKKIKVIEEKIKSLGLKNIQLSSERVEKIAQNPKYREKFDLVTTRAFAKWHTLLELALPLVKTQGHLIAYQGPQILEELEASEKVINLLGGKIEGLMQFELPSEMGERIFVIIKKIKNTPAKYPRVEGIPKKTPLLI